MRSLIMMCQQNIFHHPLLTFAGLKDMVLQVPRNQTRYVHGSLGSRTFSIEIMTFRKAVMLLVSVSSSSLATPLKINIVCSLPVWHVTRITIDHSLQHALKNKQRSLTQNLDDISLGATTRNSLDAVGLCPEQHTTTNVLDARANGLC